MDVHHIHKECNISEKIASTKHFVDWYGVSRCIRQVMLLVAKGPEADLSSVTPDNVTVFGQHYH